MLMPKNISIPQASEKIGEFLQVIAPPARMAILLSIGRGEACVCHLEASLGWRQAYISQHLMALRKADILLDRREGRYIYYRLADLSILDLALNAARLSGLDPESLAPFINARKNPACECPHCAPVPVSSPSLKEKTT